MTLLARGSRGKPPCGARVLRPIAPHPTLVQGQSVFSVGTDGASQFAVQFAKLFMARPGVTNVRGQYI